MEQNGKSGKAAGGFARASALSPERRKEIATNAVAARKERALMPQATHAGELHIGGLSLQCYVLGDGTRVLTQEGFLTALGRAGKAKGGQGATAAALGEDKVDRLPSFLSATNLKPFINNELVESTSPVVFRTPSGAKAFGYQAVLLPKVCRVYLEARDANVTLHTQDHVVRAADILMRGLAEVGIVALVDEATGYQREREKDALARILEAFVAKEIQPYMRTFPPEYYENLFRLYGLPYPPKGNRSWRPQFFGKITNEVVYARLAPDVLPALKEAASKAEKKAKLHQWLTQNIGHPKLRELLASLVTLQKLSKDHREWRQLVDRIHPRYGQTIPLPLDFEDSRENS